MLQETLPVGQIVEIGGVRKRYVGGGVFEPVGDELAKRFDPNECGPIGGGNVPAPATKV